MQGLPRIHYAPRSGATYEAPLDILIPALMKLRECDDSLKTRCRIYSCLRWRGQLRVSDTSRMLR